MFFIVQIRECSGAENPPDDGREISQQFPGKFGSYTVTSKSILLYSSLARVRIKYISTHILTLVTPI